MLHKELAAVLALTATDEAVKNLAREKLEDGETRSLPGNLLSLRYLKNPGAILGLGRRNQDVLNAAIFLMAALRTGQLVILNRKKCSPVKQAGIILQLGGGLSNLYSRISRGYVDDYLSLEKGPEQLKNIVFNLSDLHILAGTLLYVYAELTEKA